MCTGANGCTPRVITYREGLLLWEASYFRRSNSLISNHDSGSSPSGTETSTLCSYCSLASNSLFFHSIWLSSRIYGDRIRLDSYYPLQVTELWCRDGCLNPPSPRPHPTFTRTSSFKENKDLYSPVPNLLTISHPGRGNGRGARERQTNRETPSSIPQRSKIFRIFRSWPPSKPRKRGWPVSFLPPKEKVPYIFYQKSPPLAKSRPPPSPFTITARLCYLGGQ